MPGAMQAGGVARNTAHLAHRFLAHGYEVDFFLTYRQGEFLESIPQECNIYYSGVGAKRSIFELVKYLKHRRPTALITARDYLNIFGYFAIKLSRANTTQIATLRTSTFIERSSSDSLYKKIISRVATYVYRKTEHAVAVSKSVADQEERYRKLPSGTIKTIYNPVADNALFSYKKKKDPREGSTPYKLCAVGRLTEQKDFRTLIDAIDIVSKERPVALYIIGDGHLMEPLKDKVKERNLQEIITFTGSMPLAWGVISESDLLVQTSLWEGLPTVVIEALALGTNVVATDCPGGAREILEDGRYGWLPTPGDALSIATAIVQALDNPHDSHLLQNRAHCFTPEKAFDAYQALIHRDR